jgi:ABC-type molybdate transport system substrate-binding protein
LAASAQPAAALRFARYLAAPEKGGKEFRKEHYRPVAGDPWAVRPKITLFSGGVNRVAIQDTLKAFQRREGCDVSVVYHGCGTLVGMMKAGQQPDAYFACDVSFVDQVRDQFLKPLDVSETDMVILVRSGNPEGIAALADLARPEIKVGLADEQLSALGSLTKRLLQEVGLYEKVLQNRRTSSPTADFLVTQLVANDVLDAVVVYEANCAHVGDQAEIVRIDHPRAHAVQPFAIHRNNRYPQLTARLLESLVGAGSQARFESVGFRWLAEQHD